MFRTERVERKAERTQLKNKAIECAQLEQRRIRVKKAQEIKSALRDRRIGQNLEKS
jgi:hypothetical protein